MTVLSRRKDEEFALSTSERIAFGAGPSRRELMRSCRGLSCCITSPMYLA